MERLILSNDRRKLVMQFNDGGGWQTAPAMDINSTPFSIQAMSSQKLGDYPAADYLRTVTLPTCAGGEALHFNAGPVLLASLLVVDQEQ